MSNSYLFWVDVSHFLAQIGFFSSAILGSILISLNIFEIKQMFGTYKYLINTFTTLGIAFALVEAIVYPNLHSYNAGYCFFTTWKPFNLNKKVMLIGVALYSALYASTISLLAVQFIYRYWSIFDQMKMKYFQGHKCLIWFAYCLFFAIEWASGIYHFSKADTVSMEYFRIEILDRYGAQIDNVPMFAMVAYDPKDGSVRWWNLMTTVNVAGVMGIQYGVIVYCGWSMYSRMGEKVLNLSTFLKRHHAQLFKTLILQITVPTITLFFPLTLIIYLPLLNWEVSIPTGIVMCGFTLYPAMDAFIVMSVVTEYRVAIRKIFESFLKRVIHKCSRGYSVNPSSDPPLRTFNSMAVASSN